MKKLLAGASLLAMCHAAAAQSIPTIVVPSTGAVPASTPVGQQQLISGTRWINGRGGVQGPNWRDNYQIVHDILNGMGVWDAKGNFTPNLGGAPLFVPVGMVKGNGTSFSAAVAGTDYLAPLGYTPVNKAGDTMTGALLLQNPASAPTQTDLHTQSPANGAFFDPYGPWLNYCSVTGCFPGPHLFAGSLFSGTTQQDASAQESVVSINFSSLTGKATAWTPNTAYAVGTQVHAGSGSDIYQVTAAGTSASSGSGPNFCPNANPVSSPNPQCTNPATNSAGAAVAGGETNASTGADGGVTWSFVGAGLNDGKEGLSIAGIAGPNTGHFWTLDTSFSAQQGSSGASIIGYEQDSQNGDNTDRSIGQQLMVGIFQFGAGMVAPGTAAHYIGMGGAVKSYAWHYGTLVNGDNVIQDATFADATSSTRAFACLGAPHTHPGGCFSDASNSPTALSVSGSHGVAGLDLSQGTYGMGIRLPGSAFIALNASPTANSNSNIFGYNNASALLTYGLTTSANLMSIDNSGDMILAGTLNVSSPLNATSNTTGALVVAGGAGINGDVYAGGNLRAVNGGLFVGGVQLLSNTGVATLASTSISGALNMTGTAYAHFALNADNAGGINKIDLYGGAYGLGVSTGSVDYVSASQHAFYSGSTVDAVITSGGIKLPGLVTSGGTVKGTLCVDTTGVVYVKTTTGACL